MTPESIADFIHYTSDELSELYKENPDLFDKFASDAISQVCIGKTPEETIRLRQMQWTIEGQLRKAKTSLQMMQIMENIFYSRVFGNDGELDQLRYSCVDLVSAIRGTGQAPTNKPALHIMKQ